MVSGTVTLISDRDKSELEVNKLQAIIVPVNSEIKSKDIVKANIHLNTGWKNGLLIFDNTPMDEVIKKMERWFGVKIIAEGQSVLNNRFTGEFESESLIQVLEFMKITSNIKFSVKEKTYTLSEK
jgi:ferric-dicitrate binding protein FerR (iron transport regulator)